jgi:hypothetical protein
MNHKSNAKMNFAAGLGMKHGANMGVKANTQYEVVCRTKGGIIRWVEKFHNLVVNAGLNDMLTQYFKGSSYTSAFYVGLIGAGTGTLAETASANSVTGTSTAFASTDVGSNILIVGAGTSGADLATTVASQSSTTAITTTANAATTVTTAAYAVEPRPADTMSSKSFNETAPYSNANRPTLTLGSVASQSVNNSGSPAAFTVNATGRVFGAFLTTNNTVSGTTGTLYGGGLFSTSRQVLNGDTLNATLTMSLTSSP